MSLESNKNICNEYFSDPFVGVYDNIINDEECNHFIKISKKNLKRALVSDNNSGYISKGRTGSNTWISHNFDEITKKVGERIAKIVGLPLENAESFQIIHYDKEQEYKNHYDSWVHDNSEKTLRCMKWGGARLKTALCYLNDVKEGGGTKMTKLNKIIKAKKGRLLVFENTYKNNHNRHPLSEHAGMPVIDGEKYAFNLWFKECNSKLLYSKFNPDYYKNKNTIKIKSIDTSANDSTSNPVDEPTCKNMYNHIKSNDNNNKYLQIGDFFPFIKIGNKHLHNLVNDKYTLIVNSNKKIKNISDLSNKFNIILRKKDDNVFNIIPDINDEMYILLLSPNRRIKDIIYDENELLKLDLSKYIESYNFPFIKINNALDDELLNDIKKYYFNKKNKGEIISHKHSTKDRLHVHPDLELTKRIDNKLSRSVLPELRKYSILMQNIEKIIKYALMILKHLVDFIHIEIHHRHINIENTRCLLY